MTLHLADGKTFTIIAENLSKEHKYVDSITLNGESLAISQMQSHLR
jgi:putative alpha-1,2-mannosidase